jgi:hypothetical protein
MRRIIWFTSSWSCVDGSALPITQGLPLWRVRRLVIRRIMWFTSLQGWHGRVRTANGSVARPSAAGQAAGHASDHVVHLLRQAAGSVRCWLW